MAPDASAKLKAARTGKSSSLTKRIQKAQEFIKAKAAVSVLNTIKVEISDIIVECEKVNDLFIDTFTDDDGLQDAYEWMTDIESKAKDCIYDILIYVDSLNLANAQKTNVNPAGNVTGTQTPGNVTGAPTPGSSQVGGNANNNLTKPSSTVSDDADTTQIDNTPPIILKPAPLDKWVDDLIPYKETETVCPDATDQSSYQALMLRAMFERDSPKPEIEIFDGSPLNWPKFVESFYENVHRQPYFRDTRRISILQGHVMGRAKDIISGYGNDAAAYAVALKELKNWCGNHSIVARAFTERITNGMQIQDHDRKQLHTFYVYIRDCIFTLKRMDYEAELSSMDTVRKATMRLPKRLRNNWAEYCYKIRLNSKREPCLTDLENWLAVRVSALYDPILPSDEENISFSGHCAAGGGDAQQINSSYAVSSEIMPAFESLRLDADQSMAIRPSNQSEYRTTRTLPAQPIQRQNRNPRYCTFHKSSGHWSRKCFTLQRMSVEDQVKWFKSQNVCRICLGEGHKIDGSDCPNIEKFPKCDKCERKHDVIFHEAMNILRGNEPNQIYAFQNFGVSANYKNALSPSLVGHILLQSRSSLDIGILLDSGSVITLVTLRTVKLANLTKISNKPYLIVMETVGGDVKNIEAFAYKIPLIRNGTSVPTYITGYGVENIGSKFPSIDLSQAEKELGIEDTEAKYPSNYSLDLLIGMDNAHACHPTIVLNSVKNNHSLIYGKTDIGYVLFGSHPSFIRDSKSGHFRVTAYGTKLCNITDFYSTETMGVECSPKCGSCRCGKCAAGSGILSLKEEHEYQSIRDLMKLEDRIVTADYMWIKDPSTLAHHFAYAMSRLIQFENRMLKSPNLPLFKLTFNTMIELGIYRLLSKEVDEAWRLNPNNPFRYLPYKEIIKLTSATTPLRIILDPATSPDGISMNSYWTSGPKLILNPFGLQIRHREEAIAIGNDINKMYNEVRTTPTVYHCHRILYREFDQTREPDTYVVVRNSFGSRPSGTVAIAALHLVAETGQDTYPRGAKLIQEQTYVDDLLDSKRDMTDAIETMQQTEECLALGSFTLKKWTVVDAYNLIENSSDSSDSVQMCNDTETVLGVHWELATDSFKFVPKLNFSKKKRKIYTGPNLQENEIFQMTEPLTLRKILSQVNGFYDPLGLVAPYICELKFSMGKLWKVMKINGRNSKVLWDCSIPPDCDEEWRKLLNAAFHMQVLRFIRVLRPHDSVGEPWLIIMTDSSMRAFGACAYIRWTLSDGSYFCRLIAAKSRVWPIEPNDFISLCRGELQGAVLGKRLAATIMTESRFNFEKVIFILDSEIVRAQISKDSHAFDTFVANRVGEIRSKFSPDQFYTVSGSENVSADLVSRGTVDPSKLDSTSEWQNGPLMLYKDFTDWPVSQKYSSTEPLPESRDFTFKQRTMSCQIQDDQSQCEPFGDCSWTEANAAWNSYVLQNDEKEKSVKTIFETQMEIKIANRIKMKISDYSTLSKLLGVTYRFLHALSWKPGDGHFGTFMTSLKVVDAEQLELAKQFWIRDAQRSLIANIKSGKYQCVKPVLNTKTMIWHLNGRFGDHPEGYHPIILPNDHPFVYLLVQSIHSRSHCGVTATAAKVKNEYHVLKIKTLAKRVRKDCIPCRKIAKELIKVPMAPYPIERFRPAYAFEFSSCDLFGPFLLQVPGRVTRGRPMDYYGKGYGLIFTCLSSRAIHLEAMEGQDTSAFLMSLRRVMSIRGQPKYIWSDNGGQIVAADQELRDIIEGWDETKIIEYGAHNGIKFEFSAPRAPWQNGVSEALIRSVKNSILQTFASKPRLPIMNLQTIFYETAAVLNERPINLGHDEVPADWDSDTNVYLCPNQLLLGRATVRIPSGPFAVAQSKHAELFHSVEKVVNEWWKNWNTHYIPTLLRQSKWHSESRQVRVGDIVYVKDTNAIRGDWKIAEISRLIPSDKDDHIRNVELRYKVVPNEPLAKYSGCKDKFEIRDVKTLVNLLTAEERRL